jgi:hypothetical protein
VERVFGIAGVTETLPVYSDRGQALAALAEARKASAETAG